MKNTLEYIGYNVLTVIGFNIIGFFLALIVNPELNIDGLLDNLISLVILSVILSVIIFLVSMITKKNINCHFCHLFSLRYKLMFFL